MAHGATSSRPQCWTCPRPLYPPHVRSSVHSACFGWPGMQTAHSTCSSMGPTVGTFIQWDWPQQALDPACWRQGRLLGSPTCQICSLLWPVWDLCSLPTPAGVGATYALCPSLARAGVTVCSPRLVRTSAMGTESSTWRGGCIWVRSGPWVQSHTIHLACGLVPHHSSRLQCQISLKHLS